MVLDLLLYNVKIADVFRLRFYPGWVSIHEGRFIHVEPGSPTTGIQAAEKRDLSGLVLAPGLVDAHMHIESSLITPRRFARAVVPFGTTTVLSDPHEVGNLAGQDGVRWMVAASHQLPLRIYHSIPSCVPATSPDLEWTSDVFGAEVVRQLAQESSVIALGEVMDYRGLLGGETRLQEVVQAARQAGLRIEGHIPTLEGLELSEYLSYGVTSDHTQTFPEKILAQLSKGVTVMLQTKSITSENMAVVMGLPDRSQILLVTDDIEPSLLRQGHLSGMVQMAIEAGMEAVEAFASASLRPARYLGLRDLGGIAPGYQADFMILDEALDFPPKEVYVEGRKVADHGQFLVGDLPELPVTPAFHPVPGPLSHTDFRLMPGGISGQVTANVVVVQNDRNSLTHLERLAVRVEDGYARFEAGDDLALVGVFARNHQSKAVGVIKGLGLRSGAFASSLAHDSHNLLVVGKEVRGMSHAARRVWEMGGGLTVTDGEQVRAELALPVLSLLSDAEVASVASQMEVLEEALRNLGMHHLRPFLLLSVLALSVSPYYKFTDRGIVDTERRCILPPVDASLD